MAASWDNATSSPAVKFEHSPAESFLSAPGEMYPSLFEATSTPANTMNPLDIMTPGSFDDDEIVELSQDVSTPAPSDGKKQTKKRKSWGQVLPEPKTNLPPRKRAKTEDEKEQRRVERVLRNRRAAQSSRERKRLEVEALEIRNQELEAELLRVSKANYILVEELNNLRRSSGVVSRTSATLPTPVSFTPELFSSHDGHSLLDQTKSSILDELLKSASTHTTVNPSSLSPELAPVADEALSKETETSTLEASAATAAVSGASSDVTQQPAVSVVGCTTTVSASDNGLLQSAVSAVPAAPSTPLLAAPAAGDLDLNGTFDLSAALDADRYVLESGLLSSPESADLEYDNLAGDDVAAATNTIFNPFVPSTTTSAVNFDTFNIDDFLNEAPASASHHGHSSSITSISGLASGSLAADASSSSFFAPLQHPETDNPSENPDQQPPSGASTLGCDVGGPAVGITV